MWEKFVERYLGRLSERAGDWALFWAVVLVAFHHWGVLELDKIPIPHVVDIFYGYILLNVMALATATYRERRARPVPQAFCPQCRQPLQALPKFKCPQCGLLEFKREPPT